jgi:hypothetical protein
MGLRKRTAIAVLRDEIDWLFEAREALAKLDD